MLPPSSRSTTKSPADSKAAVATAEAQRRRKSARSSRVRGGIDIKRRLRGGYEGKSISWKLALPRGLIDTIHLTQMCVALHLILFVNVYYFRIIFVISEIVLVDGR